VTEREEATRRLEDVDGIGDTYADRLQRAGIETEGELAQTSAERVAEIAQVSEDRAGQWITQAQGQA
jgi:polyhydroxyalkanoate synthase